MAEKSTVVFSGLGIAALYKFITDGLKLFPSEVAFDIKTPIYTGGVGMDVLPALASVGYICGIKISSYMFAGGVLSYLVLIPAIVYFGGESLSVVMDSAGNAIAFNALSPGSDLEQLHSLHRCRCCCGRRYFKPCKISSGYDQNLRKSNEGIW